MIKETDMSRTALIIELHDAKKEINKLRAHIEECNEVYEAVMLESCDDKESDEKHCTCVPWLRKGIQERDEHIRMLCADLAKTESAMSNLRKAYQQTPEEFQRGSLEFLVEIAFRAGEISHGRAAELLNCSVNEIMENDWAQGDGLDANLDSDTFK